MLVEDRRRVPDRRVVDSSSRGIMPMDDDVHETGRSMVMGCVDGIDKARL